MSDGPHWQKIELPKHAENFFTETAHSENRAFSDGGRVWLWTGHSIVIWDLATGDWREVPPFPGYETFVYPFVRLVNSRLIVWGPWDDANHGILEGFVYDETLGWNEVAEAPTELYLHFWGALNDDSRFYVFSANDDFDLMQVGLYDPALDEWTHVEAPFSPSESRLLQGRGTSFEFLNAGLATHGHVLLTGMTSQIWSLKLETMDWSSRLVGATNNSWLTAADGRVFAWDLPDFIAEIELDPLGVRSFESTEDLGERYYAFSAGRWVAIQPSRSASVDPASWLVYDPRMDTFAESSRECEPESSSFGFVVMTDYGLVVWDQIEWNEDYTVGAYPREGRLLVFPDSKRLE